MSQLQSGAVQGGRWLRRNGRIVVLLPDPGSRPESAAPADAALELAPAVSAAPVAPAPSRRDLIRSTIDFHAQEALYRLFKGNHGAREDASGMFAAVKAGRLAGIYIVNQAVPAMRARQMNTWFWQLIPDGENAVLLLDPTNPMAGPPLIAFRDSVKADHSRLDPAIRKAWRAYQRIRAHQFVPLDVCVRPPGVAGGTATELGASGCTPVTTVVPPLFANPVGRSAKPCVPTRDDLPTVVEALTCGEVYFEFVRIFSKAKARSGEDIAAFFWIFGDALMWQVPETAAWQDWIEVFSYLPDIPHRNVIKNRMRLCRLPCTAEQSQQAVDLINMGQAELLRATADNMSSYIPVTSDDPLPSLLPTPRLYDLLYSQADIRIPFQQIPGLERPSPPSLRVMSIEYNAKVNRVFRTAFERTGLTIRPKSLGTPGKIWAIHELMETPQINQKTGRPYVCAINYGFHKGESTPTVVQSPGTRHDRCHLDYSQILVAVAGWCLTMGPNDTSYVWKRTADVYGDPQLYPLVVSNGKRLTRHRYSSASCASR